MKAPEAVDGKLIIRVQPPAVPGADGFQQVNVSSTRPLQVTRLFTGKTVDETLRLLPMIYSVCARAQACASVRAFEKHLAISPHQEVEIRRQMLVDLETIREHLWRIFLDWPKFSGQQPVREPLAAFLAIQRKLEAAINCEQSLFLPGPSLSSLDSQTALEEINKLTLLLQNNLFGMSCEEWITLATAEHLLQWQNTVDSPATALLRLIHDRGWENAMAHTVTPLPPFAPATETTLINALQDDSFIARPNWQNRCCETSSLVRNHSPLLNVCKSTFGNGLLTRALALLTEISSLACQLGRWSAGKTFAYSAPAEQTQFLGLVRAARGELIHWVELEQNRVKKYRILAPTEWNFHPEGILKLALQTLSGPFEEIKLQAQLFIELLDPCVGYQLLFSEET